MVFYDWSQGGTDPPRCHLGTRHVSFVVGGGGGIAVSWV